MVSTRSKTKQFPLQSFATKDDTPERRKKSPMSPTKAVPIANTSRKRRSRPVDVNDDRPSPKRTKTLPAQPTTTKHEPAPNNEDSKTTIINRAPVLHLWSACIANFNYPRLSWETCLSAGSAVSSICAVAKGRSIGTIPEKDDSDAKRKKHERAQEQQKDLDEIEIMHFRLRLKDGLALVGSEGKGKPGDEDALRKKFVDEQYERVREMFESALQFWKGSEDELNKKAFHFYEQFRPDVSKGQKGWGRKGELSLETVESVVGR